MEQLISRGCKLDVGDSQGNTPWHAAAESGNLEAMALFMEGGCQPDARNNAGWTALHFAARSGAWLMLCCSSASWSRTLQGVNISAVKGDGSAVVVS